MSITGIHTCPSCQMPVTFRSRDTNLVTCSHCGNRFERREDGSLKLKPNILPIQDQASPLQIGTRGVWNGKKFELIGRTRSVFDEDHNNNWTMLFDDGTMKPLVESYGQYAVYERVFPGKDVPFTRLAGLDFGSGTVELNAGKFYLLERKAYCHSFESEGEAWLFDENGRFTMLELAAEDAERLVVIVRNLGPSLYFKAHYHKPEDFSFEKLRPVTTDTVTRRWQCSQCKNNELLLFSFPLTQSFCCSRCGSSFSMEAGQTKFIKKPHLKRKPDIPLQSKGILRGVEYRVIGFMEKEDENGYSWREYTLYNPLHSYAFLSEYNGHWLFLKESADAPVLMRAQTSSFNFGDTTFELYNGYYFRIIDAQGEFPGNVFNDKKVGCREYIAPPELWAREKHTNGLCWFHGVHIKSKEITDAFTEAVLPTTVGIGAVQPLKFSASTDVMRASILAAGFALMFIYLFSIAFTKNRVVFDETIYLSDSTLKNPYVTPAFKLEKWRSNLQFDIGAPVDNSWFETGITLVNADNGKEYSIEQGVEFYSGWDDGEWTEGNRKADALMHSIPRGNYFLQLFPSKESGKTLDFFTIKVTYDVPMWRNFFILVFLALAPMAIVFFYTRYMEKLRWMNSPFANQLSDDV